ncbi:MULTISPECIES: ABC transporter ATP-binding protein [unclassified Lysobacter]|uniref:ABC transporter ATP-binding protein n=1 Tax=unclassified Lysobacter TaxID=2635362 RepID=UPI001F575DD1|nr:MULTISPECIES: ABC transporter ATP-binding protein [unclassified Lysobacter]
MSASITVERLTLSVPIYLQRERRASGWARMFLGAAFDPPRRELIRLLDDISFEAHEGDRIAILGRNGAGKSTLLRVLNGVYAPTSGHVRVDGSCQALLNMSLGFNGEATVRENIFLRGTAMGLKAASLREQIEPILDFSGLHDKSNHRLRTLSAGQRMRLGFAISTTFQHDVILMDEWVGAGDSEFMARATERMKGRVGGSKVVMLASHSVGLLRDICNKGLVLEQGRAVHFGDILSSLRAYHDLLASLREQDVVPELQSTSAEVIYGCVENLIVAHGAIHLQGWCVSNTGKVPRTLALAIGGTRHAATVFESCPRPDVMRHFGLSNDQCGFRATFAVPGLESANDIDFDLRVLGGHSIEDAHAPLRIAGAVSAMLRPSTRSTTVQ